MQLQVSCKSPQSAAVQWPTSLRAYFAPGRGGNVCCDDACFYRRIVVQYMHCSQDRVAILGLYQVPQDVLHVDAHDQLQPCRPYSSRGHHRWIPFIAYATGASALGKSVSLLRHAHWILLVEWISWMNSSEVMKCMHSSPAIMLCLQSIVLAAML